MTATAAPAVAVPVDRHQLSHVLDGVVLRGVAARLAGLLDPCLLHEAGWDPRGRVLTLPAEHPLLGVPGPRM